MKKLLKYGFYLFLPIILGSIVGLIINPFINYQSLIKPPLAPPKIIFPIAWSIIYLLLGISYYLLKVKVKYNLSFESRLYYLQLFINLLWSIIFFIFKWYFISVIWILILDTLVFTMIYLFYKKKKITASLNIFYALWLLYATYLTMGIYLLN